MDAAQELVSVVVPIYNGAPYIEKSAEMIRAQTYSNLEVFFVNDGSRDTSAAICKKVTAGDERFHLIDKENGGTARARNAGLDAAHGAYIIFLDVDDEYDPGLIEKLVRTIEKYGTDMAACGFHFKLAEEKDGVPVYQEDKHWPGSVYHDLAEIRKDYILIWDSDMFSTIWNKLFRLETLRREGIRFRDGHVYTEDLIFNCSFLSKTQSVAFLDEFLYDYIRDRPGATTVLYRDDLFDIRHSDYLDLKGHFQGLGIWDEESREFTSRQFVERVANCIENVFHAENQVSAREKYRKIKHMLAHPDVREAIQYAQCRSLKMRIFVLPIRWNWPLGSYVLGQTIYLIRKADPALFHKLKDKR